MKILITSQVYYPERFSVNEVAEGLLRLGHEVEVITGKPNCGFDKKLDEYKNLKEETINGVKVHRVNLHARKRGKLSIILNYLSFHRTSKRFVRHFKKDFDVVLSFSISPVISIACANLYAKKHKVPHVLFCQDLWPESTVVTGAFKMNSLPYKILYKWSKALYEKTDKIIVSSPSFVDYFKNVLHVEKPFVYINQPILKSNRTEKPIEYKNKYNIVYAGNIGKIQLLDELLDAMKILKGKDIMLHISGMGSELEHIKHRIEEEKLSDVVTYHGALPIEKAEAYFYNADALVVSLSSKGSVGKTVPNKVNQYMSYGRAILGVLTGDGKDLLSKANGSMFSSENPQEIASIIEKIVSLDEETKLEMGNNNKKYFDENLTATKISYLIEEELIEAIK